MRRAIACLCVLLMLSASALAEEKIFRFDSAPLSGDNARQMLMNPDRGLRLEVYLTLGTAKYVPDMFDSTGNFRDPVLARDAIPMLLDLIAEYEPESPRVAQAYFYLTEYQNRDLDQTAIDNMNAYFQVCREQKITLALRFVYVYNQGRDYKQEVVSLDQMMRHMEQIKPVLAANRDCISWVQAGFVGEWGECSPNSRWNKEGKLGEILDAIVQMVPKDVWVTTRYTWGRKQASVLARSRIGYHDDYVVGFSHYWGTAGQWESDEYNDFTALSGKVLMEGEMPWGGEFANPDVWGVAKYLADLHFTAFSLYHHYREYGVGYSLYQARSIQVTRENLAEHGLPVPYDAWFQNQDGTDCFRSLFDYIQDFLGYHIQLDAAQAVLSGDKVYLTFDMTNYGFAAPLLMKSMEAVLLDAEGNIAARKDIAKLSKIQPGESMTFEVNLDLPSAENYRLGILFTNAAGTGARLANDLAFENGVNILGELY